MNRSIWNETITETYCPPWPCPTCEKGTLSLVPKSLVFQETVTSKREHGHEAWDPDWISYHFTAWAECGHSQCKEQFAICGIGGVEQAFNPEEGYEWEKYFIPRSCRPMPHIFVVPEKCPDDVTNELRRSFELFWSHPSACAGRIRVALELLMTHFGIPKKKKDGAGKFRELSLHKRIDIFALQEPTVGPHLLALKWLGNSGSHDSGVSTSEVLDAFEILEHTLVEMIERRSKRVSELAKKLTKKHGN
jgi:hypothetical protein